MWYSPIYIFTVGPSSQFIHVFNTTGKSDRANEHFIEINFSKTQLEKGSENVTSSTLQFCLLKRYIKGTVARDLPLNNTKT